MRIRRKVLLFVSLMSVISMSAQDSNEESRQRIMEVKKTDKIYIYVDRTAGTAELAYSQAHDMLIDKVKDFLKNRGENIDAVADLVNEKMTAISFPRGNKFRAFVFVDKRQISTIDDGELQSEEETEEDSLPFDDEPQTEVVTNSNVLKTISEMTTRIQVYDYITQLQKEGRNVAFVVHPNAKELTSMYVLMYKRNGSIAAILTPTDTKGQRLNLSTGLLDVQENYPATSVNGFIINE